MQIGVYQPSQRPALIALLSELARFYGAEGSEDEIGLHLDTALVAPESPLVLVTAAESDGPVIGLAALLIQPSLVESTGGGRLQCQLKELFVTRSGRGHGVGERLLHWCASFANEQGCGRMDWNVKADNEAGIRFYERHGARRVIDRVSYRIDRPALQELAGDPGAAFESGV